MNLPLLLLGVLDPRANPIGQLPPIRVEHHVMSHAGENLSLCLISTRGLVHLGDGEK